MIRLVTFADELMNTSAGVCINSAKRSGVDHAYYCTPKTLDEMDIKVRAEERGYGYWLWKPSIIDKFINQACEENDILIYSDAGIQFINDVGHILNYMDQEIFLFGNNWEHAHWCKGDIAYTCWPDVYCGEAGSVRNVWGRYGKQVQASVIFFRVSDWTRNFVAEWLKWCLFEGGRLIDDSPSHYNNHPEFQENRHDQAILTTMAYREGIKLHWWPAIYNDGAFTYEKLPVYEGDNYPPIFHHHRKRNHEWS